MTFPNGARPYSEVEVRIINYSALLDYLLRLILPDEKDDQGNQIWTLVRRIHHLSREYQLFTEPELLIEAIRDYRNSLLHPLRKRFTHQELADVHNCLAQAINEFFQNEDIPEQFKSEYQAIWEEGRRPIARELFWDNAWAAMRALRERENENLEQLALLQDEPGYQNLYCEYLISRGLDPQVDANGYVIFEYSERTYRITTSPADPQCFCVDSYESIKGDEDLEIIYKAANKITAKAKVAKAYVTEDGNYVMTSIEVFLDKPTSFQSIFERCINELHNAVSEFKKSMRETKPTPTPITIHVPPRIEPRARRERTPRN